MQIGIDIFCLHNFILTRDVVSLNVWLRLYWRMKMRVLTKGKHVEKMLTKKDPKKSRKKFPNPEKISQKTSTQFSNLFAPHGFGHLWRLNATPTILFDSTTPS